MISMYKIDKALSMQCQNDDNKMTIKTFVTMGWK